MRVQNGFESRFDRLQLSGVDGTALHIERVNNNLWSDVFVNNCGSRVAAAVVVKSPSEGTNSNTFTCVNLTVEGSPGVAIDLAYGAHPSYFVEFVRFVGLHVEGLQKGAGDDALIRIGNVRQVEFVASIVYGGPGPLIEHRETAGRTIPLMGGVRFLGGSLLGADPARVADSAVLVRLVKGDDFALVGTRLGRFTSCAVDIAPGYGARFLVDPTTRIQTWGTSKAVIDHRAGQPEITWSWAGGIAVERSLSLAGHLVGAKGAAGAPVAENLPALGTSGPKPVVTGSDLAGTVAFGVGAGPVAGAQVRITFATAFATAPTVTLTPMSPAAALLSHHVTVTAKHFEIVLAEAIPAKGWLKYGFQVVG